MKATLEKNYKDMPSNHAKIIFGDIARMVGNKKALKSRFNFMHRGGTLLRGIGYGNIRVRTKGNKFKAYPITITKQRDKYVAFHDPNFKAFNYVTKSVDMPHWGQQFSDILSKARKPGEKSLSHTPLIKSTYASYTLPRSDRIKQTRKVKFKRYANVSSVSRLFGGKKNKSFMSAVGNVIKAAKSGKMTSPATHFTFGKKNEIGTIVHNKGNFHVFRSEIGSEEYRYSLAKKSHRSQKQGTRNEIPSPITSDVDKKNAKLLNVLKTKIENII